MEDSRDTDDIKRSLSNSTGVRAVREVIPGRKLLPQAFKDTAIQDLESLRQLPPYMQPELLPGIGSIQIQAFVFDWILSQQWIAAHVFSTIDIPFPTCDVCLRPLVSTHLPHPLVRVIHCICQLIRIPAGFLQPPSVAYSGQSRKPLDHRARTRFTTLEAPSSHSIRQTAGESSGAAARTRGTWTPLPMQSSETEPCTSTPVEIRYSESASLLGQSRSSNAAGPSHTDRAINRGRRSCWLGVLGWIRWIVQTPGRTNLQGLHPFLESFYSWFQSWLQTSCISALRSG